MSLFANRGVALRYRQGERVMYLSADSIEGILGLIKAPKVFEPDRPDARAGDNRPIDGEHKDRIFDYYCNEPNFVDGARLLHCNPGDVDFEPIGELGTDEVSVGWLSLRKRNGFGIGDGQHRLAAAEKVISSEDVPGHVQERMRTSAFAFIIVEEADLKKRNQDFVDLAHAKPVAESLGAVMDQRSVVNKLPQLVYESALVKPYFLGRGNRYRISFSGGISAKSEKLLPYTALRYAAIILLISNEIRSKSKAETKAADVINRAEGGLDAVASKIAEVLRYLFVSLPGTREIMTRDNPNVPEIREDYLSVSAGALYAICLAIYKLCKKHGGLMKVDDSVWKAAIDKWALLTWSKRSDSSFVGTLLTQKTDKNGNPLPIYTIPGNREAVDAAAELLLRAAGFDSAEQSAA